MFTPNACATAFCETWLLEFVSDEEISVNALHVSWRSNGIIEKGKRLRCSVIPER